MPRSKTKTALAPIAKPLPTTPAITKDEAQSLDREINQQIKDCNESMIRGYLTLADSLHRMKNTRGYEALGIAKWEDYLASKHDFSRGYLAFLLKVGQAGIEHFQGYVDKGLSPSKLIEYAKSTNDPEKIPVIIDATWEVVKDKPVRESREIIKQHVAERAKELRRPKRSHGGRPAKSWSEKLDAFYAKVPEGERVAFKKAMRAWLRESKDSDAP